MTASTFDEAARLLAHAIYPEDIFIQPDEKPKVVFRKLRSILHEDFVAAEKKAEAREAFHTLTVAWEVAEDLLANNLFGKKTKLINDRAAKGAATSFFVKSKKGMYTDLTPISLGEVSTVYLGVSGAGKKVAVKVSTSGECNQFLEQEAAHLRQIKSAFPTTDGGRYFPELLDSFFIMNTGNKLAVNVFEYYEGYVTLSSVLRAFKEEKKVIDVRSAAWMYNRILESLAHAGPLGIVHGGVHPDNILIHPESHRAILTGWTSSVEVSSKIEYAHSVYRHLYPPEVVGDKSKRKAYLSTDLFMAAASIIEVLGGNAETSTIPTNVPREIRAFLLARLTKDVSLRDSVAMNQRDRFSDVLKGIFGPPSFHAFVIPSTLRR
jgi:serine/threonine protein kinase